VKKIQKLAATLACLLLIGVILDTSPGAEEETKPATEEAVSFYRQVRPILQRHCSGCHQPAKQGGQLMVTSYADFQKGGENGAGFTPGNPDESLVLDYISGDNPEMPRNADPLSPVEVDLMARWIKEGAKDDTPEGLQEVISAENPPHYERPPVITALAYSPDSEHLAVSGFQEILLHKADGSEMSARLVGRSQRIESLCFSPDGKHLAAVGGTPSLFGEAQIWNTEDKTLATSMTLAPDTLFGASFNDAGTQLAFGGADNRARVIDVNEGKLLMRFDAHADWVFGTTFSLRNDHLITVSRDMSMKLVIVENAQFVDNITSITPGALKGGLVDVQRHPTKEEVLTGGSDGEPKLYKIFRTQDRKIGDDFNRIRSYAPLPGRIFDLEFNKDGSRFVVGSSTATGGSARIYETDTGKLLHELPDIRSPIFAVAYRPDGKQVAIGGFDGSVRLYDAETGQLVKTFVPVPITEKTAAR
jgi:WD40 repeat protein